MMRILMFGWEYPPHITGGLGTACYWLANALTEKGIKIDFLTPHQDDVKNPVGGCSDAKQAASLKNEMENLGEALSKFLHKISIPSFLSPYPGNPVSSQPEKQSEHAIDDALRKELARFDKATVKALKGRNYDLIHAHDWPTYGVALMMRSASNKPLILHVHSTEIDRNGESGNQFIFKLEKKGFKKADKIIAVSHYTKNVLVSHYEVNPEKIEVVYHGVPPGFDHPETTDNLPGFREKVITFCGRITRQKGPSHFIHAASKLAERSDQIRFIMAGDGDLRDEMIELTAGLGISKRFHFPGFLNKEELKRLWKISDVLVMPSVSEPFGLTGIEAMSADLPVIVSRQSGLPELFPHILQVDYWETDALADLIFDVITNTKLTLRQKQENRNRLAGLSWTTAAGQVADLYTTLSPNSIK